MYFVVLFPLALIVIVIIIRCSDALNPPSAGTSEHRESRGGSADSECTDIESASVRSSP